MTAVGILRKIDKRVRSKGVTFPKGGDGKPPSMMTHALKQCCSSLTLNHCEKLYIIKVEGL